MAKVLNDCTNLDINSAGLFCIWSRFDNKAKRKWTRINSEWKNWLEITPCEEKVSIQNKSFKITGDMHFGVVFVWWCGCVCLLSDTKVWIFSFWKVDWNSTVVKPSVFMRFVNWFDWLKFRYKSELLSILLFYMSIVHRYML